MFCSCCLLTSIKSALQICSVVIKTNKKTWDLSVEVFQIPQQTSKWKENWNWLISGSVVPLKVIVDCFVSLYVASNNLILTLPSSELSFLLTVLPAFINWTCIFAKLNKASFHEVIEGFVNIVSWQSYSWHKIINTKNCSDLVYIWSINNTTPWDSVTKAQEKRSQTTEFNICSRFQDMKIFWFSHTNNFSKILTSIMPHCRQTDFKFVWFWVWDKHSRFVSLWRLVGSKFSFIINLFGYK